MRGFPPEASLERQTLNMQMQDYNTFRAFPSRCRIEIYRGMLFFCSPHFGTVSPMSHPGRPVPPSPGPQFERRVPEGDTAERYVCGRCGHIHYSNPKIVVGTVVVHEDRFLLCRRAIEPRKGLWTLPAGFLEEHESPEDGARREAREEACADITLDALLAVYTVAHISQVQLMYRGSLATPEFSAGSESLDVRLFAWDEIPWNELAFPSVKWALRHYRETQHLATFAPFTNPPRSSEP
jgi:ADP-ribose pyrophosphatase YjhB (NUDIX family)